VLEAQIDPVQAEQDALVLDHLDLEQILGSQESAVQHVPALQAQPAELDHQEHQNQEQAAMVFHQLVEAAEAWVLVARQQDDQPSKVLSSDLLVHQVSSALDC